MDTDFARLLESAQLSGNDSETDPTPLDRGYPQIGRDAPPTSIASEEPPDFTASTKPDLQTDRAAAPTEQTEGRVGSSKYRTNKKRKERQRQYDRGSRKASQPTETKVHASAIPHQARLDSGALPATLGGYTCRNVHQPSSDSSRNWTIEELLKQGFTLLKWDGVTPRPLVDSAGRVFAVLAGRPSDPSFVTDCQRMYDEMAYELKGFDFKAEDCSHKRGAFPALPVGISYGNGQTQPSRLSAGEGGARAAGLTRLLQSKAVQRIASFGDSAFRLWAPKLYNHYKDHVDQMHEALPHLSKNFPRSVFPCASFNFGPKVQTFRHRDTLNLAYGWCSITALGNFDPTKGGHLVLWDTGLIVEFPPFSTILIPSSTILHSNISIRQGEERGSFTQYCAGGIFRWVDNGCRTQADFKKADLQAYTESMEERKKGWERGLGLYSTLQEFVR